MLIWRGLRPAAIVAAMLSVQSDWKRAAERRAVTPAQAAQGATDRDVAETRAAVPRLVLLDGAAAKSGRPLP